MRLPVTSENQSADVPFGPGPTMITAGSLDWLSSGFKGGGLGNRNSVKTPAVVIRKILPWLVVALGPKSGVLRSVSHSALSGPTTRPDGCGGGWFGAWGMT